MGCKIMLWYYSCPIGLAWTYPHFGPTFRSHLA